jgi:SNF2 family DNA or RNA helicase
VTYESLDMDDEHRRFYDAIADGVREEADKIDLKPANLLALTTRLRQATSCPSILTSQQVPATKLERCAELVEELASQGEKVVVFGTFKESIYELADMLRGKVKGSINTGDTPDDVFSADVERFQTDPKEQAFIGTFGKCSTGITLNAASYMIALDTPYTYSEFSQATDRIWRVTNQRPANVVVLSCAGTIDERVAKIVGEKKDLSDYVIDDVPNERFSDQLKSMVLEA